MVKEATAFWDGIAKHYAASPIKDIASYEFTPTSSRYTHPLLSEATGQGS